jgi:hypothetical protein
MKFLLGLAIALCYSGTVFAEIQLGGSVSDEIPSLVYVASTGDLSVEGGGQLLTTIEITSEGGLFQKCIQPPGLFDVCSDAKIFWLDPRGFESLLFEGALEANLTPTLLKHDLSAAGAYSTDGGAFYSDVPGQSRIDLVYVPEAPGSIRWLLVMPLLAVRCFRRRT